MVCYGVRQGECQNSKQFRREQLEAKIDAWFAGHGDYPYVDQRTIHGSDHADEIATVTESIRDLAGKAELADVLNSKEAEDIRAKVAILKTRLGTSSGCRASLTALSPCRPVKVWPGIGLGSREANSAHCWLAVARRS
jgi:hypothetical protein